MLNLPLSSDDSAAAALRSTGFYAALDADPGSSVGPPVLRLHGELDMASAPALGHALTAVLGDGSAEVVVDLACLDFMDSTGISVLLGAARHAHGSGKRLLVRAPNRSVRKTLRLTGVDRLLSIEPAESESS